MTKHIEPKTANQGTALATATLALPPLVIEGFEEFKGSFDRLCLQAGTAAIEAMLAADAEQLCGKRYQRHADRQGHRWGTVGSEVGWHGGKAAIRRPRVRQRGGGELELPSWSAIQKADLLSRWAFNQMLIGVATRKYARSVRLAAGDLAGPTQTPPPKRPARPDKLLGLAAVCGAEHGEAEGMAGSRPVGARPFGDPDRWAACRRPCPGGGDRHGRGRRQTCPVTSLGGDGERRRGQGAAGR